MSVTKVGSQFEFREKYSNGITMVAKFAPNDCTYVSYERDGKLLDKDGFAQLAKLTSEERMKVQDELDVERLRVQPNSKFFRDTVAKVQGSDKLAEVIGKDKLTSEEKNNTAMTMDYRKSLKPILFATIGPKGSSSPSLSENLADKDEDKTIKAPTVEQKDDTSTDKSDETANDDKTADKPTEKSDEKVRTDKPTTPVKDATVLVKKEEVPTVTVAPKPANEPVNTTQTSYGFRNLGVPNSSSYHANLMSNISWVQKADTYARYPEHVKIALGYLGLKEVPGNGSNEELDRMAQSIGLTNFNDSQTWCAVFANYVAKQVLGDKFIAPANNRTVALEQFGRKIEDISQIHAYDWVFFLNNPAHGGIFLGYDQQGNYMVLGGNQNDEVNIMRIPATSPKPEIRRMVENVQGSENVAFTSRSELSRFVVGGSATV